MDTKTTESFFSELEKIAQEADSKNIPDNLITKDRFKRFISGAAATSLGTGIGFAGGKLLGKPIERKLLQYGLKKGPAKVLRYALPAAAGLGIALPLAKADLKSKLYKRVRGEDTERNKGTKQ